MVQLTNIRAFVRTESKVVHAAVQAEPYGRPSAIEMSITRLSLPVFFTAMFVPGATLSPLFERGYTVMPEPQKVVFSGGDFRFGEGWRIETGTGVKAGDVAVESLRED